MRILLVEQSFDFAMALADTFPVIDRCQAIMAGHMKDADEGRILQQMTI
jgi:ABC-type branched-subunit amino acid transport system ATPase component